MGLNKVGHTRDQDLLSGLIRIHILYHACSAILTKPTPFRNHYLKPSQHQVLSICCAALARLYGRVSLAKHAHIGQSVSAANQIDSYLHVANKILVNTRRRYPKTNGSFVSVDDSVSVTRSKCARPNMAGFSTNRAGRNSS